MKVTHVSLLPTDAAQAAGRPALTPELLAATGARYSRSNDGLEAILSKIDPQNMDKSVDSIFKMVDYGHQSIADMAPVAMFMDGISMWLAYYIWSLCPTAGGQESSTRYLKLSPENLPDAAEIGIPEPLQDEWQSAMETALSAYETALTFWTDVATKNPDVMRIPAGLLGDSSEKAGKTVARMRRNYAFDRARYFLPAALQTNVMMTQSARAWVSLCQQLLSHPLPEAQRLGEAIRGELALVAPRLIKHAATQKSVVDFLEFEEFCQRDRVEIQEEMSAPPTSMQEAKPLPRLEVLHWLDPNNFHVLPLSDHEADKRFALDLQWHNNRYAPFGTSLQMTAVRFGWSAVALADLRDLNRHRTGSKSVCWHPRGFYGAKDQKPGDSQLAEIVSTGERLTLRAAHAQKEAGGVYWFLLGAQFPFEHTTTADKFIYEAELRTGVGAHYRYAKHLHDVLELWYQKFPQTRGLILEGLAEPE